VVRHLELQVVPQLGDLGPVEGPKGLELLQFGVEASPEMGGEEDDGLSMA
jgi:hypothetical protein